MAMPASAELSKERRQRRLRHQIPLSRRRAAWQGGNLPIDFAANCASLGAHVIKATDRGTLMDALEQAKQITDRPVCIVTEVDRRQRVGGYESWWDVAVAEVSDNPEVQRARAEYEAKKARERYFI